jgi:hypothetical protein
VLHGDFTGDEVQDVMAYYASGTYAGNAVIIGGQGDASPLIPSSGNTTAIPSAALTDPFFANPADVPGVLVGAGDASETATGLDDLIGVLGDSTNGYELDLFSTSGAGQCGGDNAVGGYGYCQTLSTTAPDGSADWNNYALATAQPQGNSSEVVLFALDKATGAMYESVNPTCDTTTTTGCGQGASGTLVGMAGTWTALSVPWGSTAPDLVSADVNNAGSLELWTESGGTAIPYTISGTTISKEGSGSAVTYPSNDWQLNDGSPYDLGNAATTATDSITGNAAQLNGTCSWPDDDFFAAVASFDGSSCNISPPEDTIATTDNSASISIWFKTTATNGVLVSVQSKAVSSGSTVTSGYNPILYVGTDGLLQAEWWPASQLASKAAVDDGLWHHAVLTDSGGTETLTLDGVVQATGTGTVNFTGEPYFDLGSGYIGGGWPDESHHEQSGSTGYPTFFNGELADVILTDG